MEVSVSLVLCCLVVIISILGNSLVCLAVLTNPSLRKTSNIYLVSLAGADLMVATIVMPLSIVEKNSHYWSFGQIACDTWISLDITCCTASILFICAISLDRYIHANDPLRYSQWSSRKMVIAIIVLIWIISIMISFVPIFLELHSDEEIQLTVIENWLSDEPQCYFWPTPVYTIISSCISFYIPSIIMISVYLKLYLFVRRAQRIESEENPAQNRISDRKAAVTIGVILGVFLICWLPFFSLLIVLALCGSCGFPAVLFTVFTWLGYANSGVNPVIYTVFNSEFREAFKRILSCGKWGSSADESERESVSLQVMNGTNSKSSQE